MVFISLEKQNNDYISELEINLKYWVLDIEDTEIWWGSLETHLSWQNRIVSYKEVPPAHTESCTKVFFIKLVYLILKPIILADTQDTDLR